MSKSETPMYWPLSLLIIIINKCLLNKLHSQSWKQFLFLIWKSEAKYNTQLMWYTVCHIQTVWYTVCILYVSAFSTLAHKHYSIMIILAWCLIPNHQTVVTVRIKDESWNQFCGSVYKCSFPKKCSFKKMIPRISFYLFDHRFRFRTF